MLNNRKLRLSFFLVALLAICLFFVAELSFDYRHCMNVPVIDPDELVDYSCDLSVDLTSITYNGQHVAADVQHQTLILSQAQGDLSHYAHLKGELATVQPTQKLYFIHDEAIDHLENTVHNGYPLRLAVVEEHRYAEVRVVLTTLPVLCLQGEETSRISEKGHPVLQGTVSLFAGYDHASGSISVHSYAAQWNIRGASTADGYKKPWKLSLKTAKGDNRNVNLLGLGKDDDWILNPMSMDDTKVREKMAMDLWNHYIASPQKGNLMSTGEYVEVVNNGEYVGLYLLQRRVDEKYLSLNRAEDILFKGKNTWTAATLPDGYELIYSPVMEEEAYWILAETLDKNRISLESYADMSVLLQFLNAQDNRGYKNMFYLLRPALEGYQLHWIPWDTDFSMGLVYRMGFEYDFAESLASECYRLDHETLVSLYPQLPAQCAERWYLLRDGMFHPDNLTGMIRQNADLLLYSGGYKRDIQRWGLVYQGEDTWDSLIRWCEERVLQQDSFYQ